MYVALWPKTISTALNSYNLLKLCGNALFSFTTSKCSLMGLTLKTFTFEIIFHMNMARSSNVNNENGRKPNNSTVTIFAMPNGIFSLSWLFNRSLIPCYLVIGLLSCRSSLKSSHILKVECNNVRARTRAPNSFRLHYLHLME